MKTSKLFALGGLAVGAALSPQVLGAPGSCHAPGVAINWQDPDFPSTPWWSSMTDGCEERNVIYKYLTSSADLNTSYAATTVVANNPTPGTDLHKINFSILPNLGTPATYTITYSAEIDLVDAPRAYFTTAYLSSDTTGTVGPNSTLFTSAFYRSAAMAPSDLLGTVVSTNSSPSLHSNAINGLTKIWVVDTYTANGTAVINSGTDYLLMTEGVPEPATLILFGAGLAGLGANARRRTADTKRSSDCRR